MTPREREIMTPRDPGISMTHLLFESIMLPAGLALGGFVLLVLIGRNMEHRRRGRIWLIWMVSVVGLFLLQKLVVTDREVLTGELRRLVRAVETQDAATIGIVIDDSYAYDGQTHKTLMDWIRGRLDRMSISGTMLTSVQVAMEDGRAEMNLTAMARVGDGSGMGGTLTSAWRLVWRKTGEETWRIVELSPVKIAGQPVTRLQDIPR
jgi:hypothetical protein